MPLRESWLELETAMGGRAVLHGTVPEMRATFGGIHQMLQPLYPSASGNVDAKDGDVDGIKYRVYTPKDHRTGGLPLAMWTHGGGFMLGDLETDDWWCSFVAEHSSSIVVNIDYRLSPEVKTPTHLEDCWKVYKWAHKNASSFGADNSKVYTIGSSAGGCLALALANRAVQDPELKPGLKGIVALVPLTCHWDAIPGKYQHMHTSATDNATNVPIIDKESNETLCRAAALDPKDSSYLTLLAEENHRLFPPTYFAACEYDPLRDDAFTMQKALEDKGVETKLDYWTGLPHYFWTFPQLRESEEFKVKLLEGIEWVKSQM